MPQIQGKGDRFCPKVWVIWILRGLWLDPEFSRSDGQSLLLLMRISSDGI